MSTIILSVLKEDFVGTDFVSPWNCVLAKAANRQFETNDAAEGLNEISIKGKDYTHRMFGSEQHDYYKGIADKSEPGSEITQIILKPYEPVSS